MDYYGTPVDLDGMLVQFHIHLFQVEQEIALAMQVSKPYQHQLHPISFLGLANQFLHQLLPMLLMGFFLLPRVTFLLRRVGHLGPLQESTP